MTKVYVGMSGGVDSSVTAALLKEQGHDVTGVYMKNWTRDMPGLVCPWAEDLADAKRVAVQLDIPFKVFDFESEYKQKVVDYMIEEYKAGRTPNPDVMCNQEVKFKLFLQTALEDGAEMIAMGHYSEIRRQMSDARGREESRLFIPKDNTKDQTYFLYRVTEEALSKTLFPLGKYTKAEVRKMAQERGLLTAFKKDSQGICFVGKVGIKDFLSQYVQTEPGDIIDSGSGKVIGRHDGAIFYTIGQRHGLDIGGGLPYYVAYKDMAKNEVYVTTDLNDAHLWKKKVALRDLHWINDAPKEGQQYEVRLRYRAPLVPARITELSEQHAVLELEEPEKAVAAGQSAVLYDGGRVAGGGIIS